MKKVLSILSLVAFVMGSTFVSAQVRDLDNYDQVDVSMGIKVKLIPSNENKADIDISKGDYDDLITEVRNRKLTIKWKKQGWFGGNNNRKASIDLYYTGINSVEASSGSRVYNDDELSSEEVDVQVSSGATVELEVSAEELDVDVSSGANCTLRGKAEEQTVDVSSGATYNGMKMQTDNTNVDVSSGASAKVWVTERLDAEASSGGSVQYKGNPKKTDIDAGSRSGGSVKKIGGDSDY